ncbi:MAG: MATE family efflux transporter [Clostridiaceae bacterium]
MLEGKISKSIILFALPIFLGNLFQQLYNVVDSLVVGNVLGDTALAAVTSTGSLIFLMVGFIHGIFVGSGVTIANYFGAKNHKKLTTAVHTTLAFAFLTGLILTVVGVGLTPWALKMMAVPDNVFPAASEYLRIYFLGGIPIVLYNACVGIFQAVGDSKRPLYYLIAAAVLNVVLDILFVAFLNLGVGGAAWATVLSQLLSAVLAFFKLTRVDGVYKVDIKKIGFNIPMLKKLLRMGIPSGVQNSVVGFANVIVQSNINVFGSIAMAGSGSYTKLEGFAFLPITSFSLALTTFIGQNLGAKQYDRAKKGAGFGMISGVILSEVIGIVIFVFAPVFIRFFNDNPDVIATGTERARIISLFFFLLAFSHLISGVLRGAGRTKIPMIVMLMSWCIIRIAYITITLRFIPDIRVVFWAYPLTWTLSSIAFIWYFKTSNIFRVKDSVT